MTNLIYFSFASKLRQDFELAVFDFHFFDEDHALIACSGGASVIDAVKLFPVT